MEEVVAKRATVSLLAIFVVYTALVATHKGEFWPFSIYPMFSQAGNPWTRVVVRVVDPAQEGLWDEVAYDDLPGEGLALVPNGIPQNDLTLLITRTTTWNEVAVRTLRGVFAHLPAEQSFLIVRVRGEAVEGEGIVRRGKPFALVTAAGVTFASGVEVVP